MIQSDKLGEIFGCESRLQNNCQEIDNSYLWVFLNHFVKKFRQYNNDEFLIVSPGLNNFFGEGEKVLTYLLEQLQEYKFTVNFYGELKSFDHIDITCKNITQNTSYNFKYQIQNINKLGESIYILIFPILSLLSLLFSSIIISKYYSREKYLTKFLLVASSLNTFSQTIVLIDLINSI